MKLIAIVYFDVWWHPSNTIDYVGKKGLNKSDYKPFIVASSSIFVPPAISGGNSEKFNDKKPLMREHADGSCAHDPFSRS